MSDEEWETDPDFANSATEQEQRYGQARKAGTNVDMEAVKQEVRDAEAGKAKAKSGFERGYGGEHGNDKDQTTEAKPGKKTWQPKELSFEDKMANRRNKEGTSEDDVKMAASASADEAKAQRAKEAAELGKQSAEALENAVDEPKPPKPSVPPPKPLDPPPKPDAPPPKPNAPPPKPANAPPAKAPPPKPAAPPPAADPPPPATPPPKPVAAGGSSMSPSQSEDVQTLGFQAMAVTDVTLKSQAGEGTAYHSYGEEKVSIFSEFINSVLAADPHLSDVLPVDPHSDNLFVAIQSGILLCKLINLTQPGIIFEKAINLKVKTIHHKLENQNLAINSAKAIGCNVVNISAEDLIEGKPHLVLGLVWQIIKIMLFKKVSLREVPELAALLKEGEQLADFLKLSPEEILLRWVNYHLEKAGCDRTCTNFGSDMKDGVVYTHLMQQICPEHCTLDPLSEADPRKRAGKILVNAQRMDCRKFVTPEHIVNGNAQMNMAFTALLYNKFPGLSLPVESGVRAEMAELLEEQGSEDSREERVFRNWINSLGLSRDVNALAEDCRSGEVLLEAMEKLVPQAVDWKQVTKNTKIQIKTIQNCNYAVNVANKIGIKTVNLGGADIAGGGNLKLLLGLMWQLMRFDTISLLEKLGGGKKVSDSDMVKWANEKVGSKGKMASFQDAELASGRFFLYLCDSITPGVVNWDIVTPGVKDEDKEMNAKYVLSVARKMGATPFLLWEDIVEVKPKMLMTLVGAIMVLDRQSRIKQKEAGQAV